jgi:hypothetical protein
MAVVLPKPAGARTSTSFTVAAAAISSPMAVRGTCVAVKAGGLSLVSRILAVEAAERANGKRTGRRTARSG